ncbi:TetR family transcriptional regulator [Actinomadura sp. NBRC 104425]|uniref:acyl-CoA-like ligand-binding transcription factor n=1 Tax=Actinomadura sp. NBRC 104425 TaxID=3032204 RepID=UPI0024A4A4B4|nr:TetR family transcriptional regulator [Actinomadura sp. NBRC 104425]GLZ15250.1 TetR family transcriptional regulator [Actinomadura sp. NBRC 104425]
MTVEMGLRERKKAATREALIRAAVRLVLARGVEGVTVEAIADEAGVSPRTFHNYFPGKEEAIVGPMVDGVRELIDAVRARPADEPVWESLRHAVVELLQSVGHLEETIPLLRVIKDEPALLAWHMRGFAELQEELCATIAERTGTDAKRDPYPRLMAGTVGLAIRVVLDLWTEGRTDTDITELFEDAFARLRAGLPTP